MGVINPIVSRIALESRTIEGESPVDKNNLAPAGHLSTAGHANPAGI